MIQRVIAKIAAARNPADKFWRSGDILGAIGLGAGLITRIAHVVDLAEKGSMRIYRDTDRRKHSLTSQSNPLFASMRFRLRHMTGGNQQQAATACAGRAAREAAARPPPIEAAPLHPFGFAVAGSQRDEVGTRAIAHPAAPSKPGSTAPWPTMSSSSCSGTV